MILVKTKKNAVFAIWRPHFSSLVVRPCRPPRDLCYAPRPRAFFDRSAFLPCHICMPHCISCCVKRPLPISFFLIWCIAPLINIVSRAVGVCWLFSFLRFSVFIFVRCLNLIWYSCVVASGLFRSRIYNVVSCPDMVLVGYVSSKRRHYLFFHHIRCGGSLSCHFVYVDINLRQLY